MDERLAQLKAALKDKPAQYPKNEYWEFDHDQIINLDGHLPITIKAMTFQHLLAPVINYFRQIYAADQTEAQVLILTQADYEKLAIPVVALKPAINFARPNQMPTQLRIVILPQVNTLTNTIVSETLWQNQIVNAGIKPVMRIHSHHQFDAYQSLTDYNSLNSGTLEMVVGKINDARPQIAYWLDTYGQLTKQHVFKTLDFGEHVMSIENGADRGPTKISPRS